MHKKILAIFAHPDDEAFGPGGTLAKYASEGATIHLLCATRGEAGQWDTKSRLRQGYGGQAKISQVREKELLTSAKILGVTKVDFLDYMDGRLCNAIYHELAEKIMAKIKSFKPDVIITIERRGVSGHLDHIAISMITTYAHLKTKIAKKLYYHCLSDTARKSEGRLDNYFVYFPEGYKDSEITTKIDFLPYWDKKVAAMNAHQSQIQDVRFILKRYKHLPKTDCFILQFHHRVQVMLPETDLFAGIT